MTTAGASPSPRSASTISGAVPGSAHTWHLPSRSATAFTQSSMRSARRAVAGSSMSTNTRSAGARGPAARRATGAGAEGSRASMTMDMTGHFLLAGVARHSAAHSAGAAPT